MSELVWVAIPGGLQSGRQLIRVLVVPKLDGGTLDSCGMAIWPPQSLGDQTLAADWRADESGTSQEVSVPPADVILSAQPGLWQRFFAPSTAVGAGRQNGPHPEPVVSPTASTASDIDGTYSGAAGVSIDAAQPGPPPEYHHAVADGLARWNDGGAAGRAPAPPATPAPAPPPLAPPGFDRVISLLREHPAVLRALGLVFDVRVTAPEALAGGGEVRIRWPGADASLPQIVSPWTQYGRGFLPDSASGEVSAGMATLTPDPTAPAGPAGPAGTPWKVVTVDVDGASRKLRDAALLVAGGAQAPSAIDPALGVSLPALRTAGLQLVRAGRSQRMARRRGAAEPLDGQVLDADDLVLGYRLDVRRGNEWRSLHERLATYTIAGTPIGEPGTPEEGHVKVNGAVRQPDGGLSADETVARWSGWSLSVARPRFDAPEGAPGPERVGGLPFEFDFAFEAKSGSLPALRFTATYDLRARVVDMAGGALQLGDAAADRCAISGIAYRRYEPVSSPGLALESITDPPLVAPVDPGAPAPASPGEAVDRVVVRSAPGVSIDQFPVANSEYVLHAGRSLTRPATSLAIAEQHGMLDAPGLDAAKTFAMVQRAVAAGGPGQNGAQSAAPLPDPAAGGIQVVARGEPGAPAAAPARRSWTDPWPEPGAPKTLELRARGAAEPAVIWEDDTLVVRLAPAEQLTLELSSTLTENFLDHFALQDAMPSDSKAAAEAGRHPLITPTETVTLVHAIRRPLSDPSVTAQLSAADRDEGHTVASLNPAPALLGIDANSTAQLDITAAWAEVSDNLSSPLEGVPVQSVKINRGDTTFADPLRHEFGDTRHRDVTYTLTSVSRFRQYFTDDEPPEQFLLHRPVATVNVLSSATPPPPVVVATVPATVWSESTQGSTIHRNRAGGWLRVELARPWYQTGAGERLAVILWDRNDSDVQPSAELLPFITQAGRDPIWSTVDLERWPTEPTFAGTVGPAASVQLTEVAHSVLAVVYEPWFHGDRWYADVALPGLAAASYSPFVQLALARYQPDSIAGHALSPVVASEMVQLLPDRALTVTRTGNTVSVALTGLGPAGPSPNRVDVLLEQCPLALGSGAEALELTSLTESSSLPAWTAVPGAVRQTTLGAGAVQLPIPAGSGATRVRVREVELIGADAGVPAPQTTSAGELGERVVFTDVVLVPAS